MRAIGIVVLGSALVAGAACAAESPLAPLSRLAGHCWKGEFAEGGSWDRHCFEWAYDGKFLHDKHVVTGKRAPYGGETFYRYDGKAQRIEFHYFNSQGGYSEGHVQPAQNELRFPEERYEQGGKAAAQGCANAAGAGCAGAAAAQGCANAVGAGCAGAALVLRTIWRFEGETRMLAVTEQQKDGQWVEAWRIAFARE